MDTGANKEVETGTNRRSGPRSFFEVVLGQRACRQFSDEPVGDDLVEQCLRAATHAPSAENRQPWVFVVARRPEVRAGIAELTREVWQDAARQSSLGRLSDDLFDDVDRGAATGMASAPVIIVVCGDTALGLEVTLPSSVYLATQNLLLSAAALGLGSAMTTLATIYGDRLRQLLELPGTVKPMAVVPLGWPDRPLGPPRRLPLEARVHRDRYGQPW
jgi:nitroreductase